MEAVERTLRTTTADLAKANKQVEGLRGRLAAAADELTRRRKAAEALDASLASARKEVQELRIDQRQMVESFRQAYLAALAPGRAGLDARRQAAAERRMIERLAGLTGKVRSERARKLVERLEVVLTRLDLMNPDRLENRESFQRIVGQSDLESEIDAVLASPMESKTLRSWLFEAKLILLGGLNAG